MAASRKQSTCHPEKLNKAGGLCANCYARDRYNNVPGNKEKVKLNSRNYTKKNPEKIWEFNLRQKFRLERYQYDQLLVAQGYGCAICREIIQGKLAVDHNHKDGRVRGLLCNKCNMGIGLFNDNPVLLKEAVLYLNNPTNKEI